MGSVEQTHFTDCCCTLSLTGITAGAQHILPHGAGWSQRCKYGCSSMESLTFAGKSDIMESPAHSSSLKKMSEYVNYTFSLSSFWTSKKEKEERTTSFFPQKKLKKMIVSLDADISDEIRSRVLVSWSVTGRSDQKRSSQRWIITTLSVMLVKQSFHFMVDNKIPGSKSGVSRRTCKNT